MIANFSIVLLCSYDGVIYIGIDDEGNLNGVYVRQGASGVSASPDQIRRIIKYQKNEGISACTPNA